MKNVQVIDGAENCVYDIFSISEAEFAVIFPDGTDVAFVEEVGGRVAPDVLNAVLQRLWAARCVKSEVQGLHGTLFFECTHKMKYYPERREATARNPGGTALR
jgi:hypothetical protein